MGINAALDVAIGLILTYLVLSLVGTVVNEYVATIGKWRATTLEKGLQDLIDDGTLRADFYNHGLIGGTNAAAGGDHASYLSGRTFALAILGSVDPMKPIPGFQDVKTAIENMPDSNIRDTLLAQLSIANGSLEKLRDGIANHFDNAMDRVSGVYKRYLKLISICVGFVLCAALNADSIIIAQALWKDSSLRAQIVQNADKLLTEREGSKNDGAPTALKDVEQDIRPVPLGWPDPSFPKWGTGGAAGEWLLLERAAWLLLKFVGLAISALAISLGAPFWFDVLSKFMNVRGAGDRPVRTVASGG